MKDFKLEMLGNETLERYLSLQTDAFNNWYGHVISYLGHTFYIPVVGATTWQIDVDSKVLTKIGYSGSAYFAMHRSLNIVSSTEAITYFSFFGDSTLYKFNDALYADGGTNFTCEVVTDASDFDTLNRKTMGRASILCDRPPSDALAYLSWSDDDYQSFNTPVGINLNQDLPSTYRLGSFRQRIFKLSFTNNTLFRIMELEVDINKGLK